MEHSEVGRALETERVEWAVDHEGGVGPTQDGLLGPTLDHDAAKTVSGQEDVGLAWQPGISELLQRVGEQLWQLQRVGVVADEPLRDGHPQRVRGGVLDRQPARGRRRSEGAQLS